MQFVHIADNHLGYRQYNLDEREKDIYRAFKECIDKIIEIKPDFVVHSGDLFEHPEPSVNALYTAIEGFKKLMEHNIPIYIIHGNHDKPRRDFKKSPFTILKKVLGDRFKTFFRKKCHIFEKEGREVFIGGNDFTSRSNVSTLHETYKMIEVDSKNYKDRILLFHQSLYSYSNLPTYEIQLDDLPQGFKYYAGGHIHQRILRNVGDGILAYSGSTEIYTYDEYEDYEKNGKGFYLVDISREDCDVDRIDIKCRDFVVEKGITDEESFKRFLEKLKSKNEPVVICSVLRDLSERLERALKSKKTLYNRITYLDGISEEEILDIAHMDIEEVFREFLKSRNYDVNFVYGIYDEVIRGRDLYKYLEDYFRCF
ncbi:DNA repair exonuclease [Methanofervidicoccus sp. A16]|uniref:DNA repair exonuclease n=1 Tax=Methanofervidicoccus sp. A16 TaxID=2607662 RepID=UPI00118CEB46|nr:exonuclease SbcCD subunit D [Methanofervidicoccus sp. A16]AXI25707.1 DNA repair exonuclease [Methanofervidicoccus sp. A16]